MSRTHWDIGQRCWRTIVLSTTGWLLDANTASVTQISILSANATSGQRRYTVRVERCEYHVSRFNVAGRLYDPGGEGNGRCSHGRGQTTCIGHWNHIVVHRRYVSSALCLPLWEVLPRRSFLSIIHFVSFRPADKRSTKVSASRIVIISTMVCGRWNRWNECELIECDKPAQQYEFCKIERSGRCLNSPPGVRWLT